MESLKTRSRLTFRFFLASFTLTAFVLGSKHFKKLPLDSFKSSFFSEVVSSLREVFRLSTTLFSILDDLGRESPAITTSGSSRSTPLTKTEKTTFPLTFLVPYWNLFFSLLTSDVKTSRFSLNLIFRDCCFQKTKLRNNSLYKNLGMLPS